MFLGGAPLEVDSELVARVEGSPMWLRIGPEAVYAVLHTPTNAERRRTAVLIVPPFGWEDACSYRPRREWAIALAQRGFAAARIDLPGTGDSAGDMESADCAASWLTTITAGAGWLKEVSGAERLAVIGIGLGGHLAVQAAGTGAPIDELVLWGVRASGRATMRELRAYAAMIATGIGDQHPAPPPAGLVDLAGYRLSADCAAALGRIDLTGLDLSGGRVERALLIERDAGGVDEQLHAYLVEAGVEVTIAPGSDFKELMAPPQEARVPRVTIERTLEWLEADPLGSVLVDRPGASEAPASSVEFEVDGVRLRETLFAYDADGGRIVGVLTEPAERDRSPAPVCVVFPNAGSLRRIGPNRMWTEAARRAAARGCAAVRLDIPGLGDADGDPTRLIENAAHYEEPLVAAELDLLDRLERAGVATRFLAVGLCSSSYWGWHAALRDERVVGAILLNLYAFEYSTELVLERDRRRTVAVVRRGLLARLRRKGLPKDELRRALVSLASGLRPGARVGTSREDAQLEMIANAFDLLAGRGTQVLFLFSDREGLLEQLDRQGQLAELGRWPNLAVERLPTRDHSMRVAAVQALVRERIDRAIGEYLATAAVTQDRSRAAPG